MALTFTKDVRANFGSCNAKFVTLTPDTSYPTGGWACGRSELGMNSIHGIACLGHGSGGYRLEWDLPNELLICWRTGSVNAVDQELPAGTDLSAQTMRILVMGY